MIVDVINPMLLFTVTREGLGVFEALLAPVDLPEGWVVLDCLNHAMS